MRGSNQIGGLQCEASAESIMDYGQNIVLSTGNFLCSAPSMNSTMDFSKKQVEDGVVDSPIEKKGKVAVGNSASSLHAKARARILANRVRENERRQALRQSRRAWNEAGFNRPIRREGIARVC